MGPVPHGEESHTGKEDCGSRETMDEPTAHGSQIVPATASILLNKDKLYLYLHVKLPALLKASDAAGSAQEQALSWVWSRNRVGEDQEAKEAADLEDTGQAGGIFTDYRGLNDPAWQGTHDAKILHGDWHVASTACQEETTQSPPSTPFHTPTRMPKGILLPQVAEEPVTFTETDSADSPQVSQYPFPIVGLIMAIGQESGP
ncbi:hypothetical protein WISP_20684 [Willisornis vidua]|uniref:Uncharacterized protein n=1 Tax=Willisornis vidua TaxID=1566151 RepID=A0ABQ9DNX9_9PASS|nr:hypothetical protein WISP_20684 [Willisornis vidua]